MIVDNLAVLELLQSDQMVQEGIFKPGVYWKPYISRINYYIRKDGLAGFRGHEGIGKGYTDTVTRDPFVSLPLGSKTQILRRMIGAVPFVNRYVISHYEKLINHYFSRATEMEAKFLVAENRQLLEKYKDKITTLDTMAGDPQQYFEFDGRKIAFFYVEILRRYDALSSLVPLGDKRVFMEVGGGFGAMTHTLLSFNDNIRTCFYVDIPPMLHVATEYLRHHFGSRVMDYVEYKAALSSDGFNPEGRIVCIPPWVLSQISYGIDLFWNSNSFQEMDSEQISFYGKWVASNAQGTAADVMAVFYPYDSYERGEKRTTDLLSACGMRFENVGTFGEYIYMKGAVSA